MQQNAPFCILLKKKNQTPPLLVSRGLACSFRDVLATNHFGHSLYIISMDEETECRSLYISMDY